MEDVGWEREAQAGVRNDRNGEGLRENRGKSQLGRPGEGPGVRLVCRIERDKSRERQGRNMARGNQIHLTREQEKEEAKKLG